MSDVFIELSKYIYVIGCLVSIIGMMVILVWCNYQTGKQVAAYKAALVELRLCAIYFVNNYDPEIKSDLPHNLAERIAFITEENGIDFIGENS